MESTTPLPSHMAEKAASIKAQITSQLPQHSLLSKNVALPLDSTTLIEFSNRLSKTQIEIISLDACSLVEALEKKKYTAVETTEAYCIAASLAHQALNCLTWYDSQSALKQAQELDEYMEKNSNVKGPLHGVVISIKQLINVKDWPQNASHLNFEEFVPKEDALLVRILREAGAIFMVKTTQPQSIMQLETASHNYGVTRCAYNRNCTSGGSSGGEGALVAMRGSTIGVGTDIGGSIRNPAAFNGLWGFKTSSKRLPRDGLQGGLSGGTHHARIRGCIGPLTRSLRDMELFLRVCLDAQCWKYDSSLLPLPWRNVDERGKGSGYDSWSGQGGKLRVGVMRDDGRVKPVASIRRGMNRVVDALKGKGVECVEVEPKWFEESWELITSLYYIDGGKKLRAILGEEPLLPLTEWVVSHSTPLSPSQIDQLIIRREQIRQEYLTYFRSLNLDIILLPAGPAPAQMLGTTKYWSYTSLFNLLDWPGAVFPTGLYVDPKLDLKGDHGYEGRNDDERHLYKTYSAETSVGCPIGLQVVAPRNEDERLMGALKIINEVLPLSS